MPTRHADQGQEFRVDLSARVVESFRGAWSPLGDSFADPGIALDFLQHLEPTHGPTLVRASVTCGTRSDRWNIDGEWFCDDRSRSFGPNALLRKVPAAYSRESARWWGQRSVVDAWETCEVPSWMLYFAALAGVRPSVVVLAACDCARVQLALVPPPDESPTVAIATVEAWSRGESTAESVLAAGARVEHGTENMRIGHGSPHMVARRAAVALCDAAYYAATFSASSAGVASAASFADEAPAIARMLTDKIRERVALIDVLRSLRGAA